MMPCRARRFERTAPVRRLHAPSAACAMRVDGRWRNVDEADARREAARAGRKVMRAITPAPRMPLPFYAAAAVLPPPMRSAGCVLRRHAAFCAMILSIVVFQRREAAPD